VKEIIDSTDAVEVAKSRRDWEK